MSARVDEEITWIRTELREADRRGVDELLPLIYDELRRLASGYLRDERSGHTLQTTAPVIEADVRLAKHPEACWHDRAHFFRVAAKTMPRILINHAVQRRAQKRGGGRAGVALEEVTAAIPGREADLEMLVSLVRDSYLAPSVAGFPSCRSREGIPAGTSARRDSRTSGCRRFPGPSGGPHSDAVPSWRISSEILSSLDSSAAIRWRRSWLIAFCSSRARSRCLTI